MAALRSGCLIIFPAVSFLSKQCEFVTSNSLGSPILKSGQCYTKDLDEVQQHTLKFTESEINVLVG